MSKKIKIEIIEEESDSICEILSEVKQEAINFIIKKLREKLVGKLHNSRKITDVNVNIEHRNYIDETEYGGMDIDYDEIEIRVLTTSKGGRSSKWEKIEFL